MGLDVNSVKLGKLVQEGEYDEKYDDRDDEFDRIYRHPHFPEQADDLKTGYYEIREMGDGFRAGSYSGYSQWRTDLADLVGTTPEEVWEKKKPGPFFELINFSDCEGCIGSKTSEKLAADFAKYEEEANRRHGVDSYFMQKYRAWKKAFEFASDGGAVCLH